MSSKLKEYNVFVLKEKVGMLIPNIDWVVYENPHMEWKKPTYKVMLEESDEHKPIGVVYVDLLDEAIEKGICVLKGNKKFKRKTEKAIDKK
ncbi:MAG: hypothetical protein ACRCZ0_00095 [Cetobacterium sp.]